MLVELIVGVKTPALKPSNLILSAELIDPESETVASVIDIAGVSPPLDTIGAVPVTVVTPDENTSKTSPLIFL